MRTVTLAAGALLALALVPSAPVLGDPPAGYYSTVDPTTQAALRTTLHEVIDDHIRFPYTSGNTDTWVILELADEDPADSFSILDLYKNATYPKVGGGTGSYQREHTWPSSYGFPNDVVSNYPFTDCHHLFLADGSYNASRGNTLYRTCGACTERPTLFNHGRGGGSGVYPGNSNWRTGSGSTGTWETWIGRRGEVARALFYLDVRYEGGTHGVTGHAEPDLILTDDASLITTSGGVNTSVAYMGILSVLLAWHKQDPVDDLERARNDVVASFQGNRNPFIDYPEWAKCAMAGDCGSFYTVTPCRVVDTRNPEGPYGGPPLTSGDPPRLFTIPGQCGIPVTAESVSVNVTVVNPSWAGHLTLYPADRTLPLASTINFSAGQVRANNAVLALGREAPHQGVIAVWHVLAQAGQVDLIIDVNGYFD